MRDRGLSRSNASRKHAARQTGAGRSWTGCDHLQDV